MPNNNIYYGNLGVIGSTGGGGTGSTVLNIQGTQGQLFSVVDGLTGSLMSVNDISGIPILEVFSDDRVVMGTYGAPGLVVAGSTVAIGGTGSSGNFALAVTGYVNITPLNLAGTGSALTLSGTNTLGGVGYMDFLRATNTAAGATGNKYFRLGLTGDVEIINSAYSATILRLTNSGTLIVPGAMSAGSYVNLPNNYLYVTRTTSQTIPSGVWANTDIIFNNVVVSSGIPYNTGNGLASLTAGKVYRITSRVAWSASAAYIIQISCYDSSNTPLGPIAEYIQPPSVSFNTSDGTMEFIYAPSSNVDIKIRTSPNTTALSGEFIRGDLNTQMIIQQIA
jgi:hypothetical protein